MTENIKTEKINVVNTTENRVVCHYPWTSLYVSPNGDVKHCCSTNLSKLGNLSLQTVDEVWNGDLFKTIREKISAGDFEGAYCNSNCQGLRTGDGYPWPEKTIATKLIIDNENLAEANFNNGISHVNHKPTQLHLEFSNHCNLRCIMCFYEFKKPYSFIPDTAVTKILEIADCATSVTLMGGEVFLNKNDLRFIEEYTASEGAAVGFVTNATLLDEKMIELLKKFKLMAVQISIDGTSKEVYEKVRKRGNWDVTDSNIRRLVDTSKKLKEFGYIWNIDLAFVVLKTNLANVSNSIKYAIELGIPIEFHPVKGFHLYEENIFVYKKALNATGDWKQHLKDAYTTLESSKGAYEHYDRVLTRLKDVEQFLQQPKISVSKWVVKLLRKFAPGENSEKQQGLNEKDRRVGHVIEIYYNWRVGNTSFKSTLSYVLMKVFPKKKEKRAATKCNV